ncbi:GTP pyrophosphokinase [Hyphomonas chukchiensis]|uniref:RelA/SpoT domain-containing protein n=1 Tax=Hyphomonas chukchiensis TaxID=1280947 RepID=A0A062UEL6_9PROT|nr:hypothetical protein [Hyphomonas chukchiensis]KCZ56747.1 hypothetical protein HY30_06415 [Hyphomonas chukchiensis]
MISFDKAYQEIREKHLVPLAARLELHLKEVFEKQPRVDRISCRAKAIDSFVKKAAKLNNDGSAKYSDPLEQIQDVVGARIVTFYRPDVEALTKMVETHFTPIEEKELSPNSEYEFGYFGKHFVLLLPSDVLVEGMPDQAPEIFELQIKTVFQHAWSEASHDLDYKEENEPLTFDDKRKIAFASAQAWGADNAFEEIARSRIVQFRKP